MPVLVEGLVVPAGFAVTTQEVGGSSPQAVQVVVTGMDAGDAYSVTGSAVGFSWPVRGGRGVATGGQLVLTDLLAPVNTPVTYTATVGDSSATSDPVTVDYAGRYVLQSLNGRRSASFRWLDNGDPREARMRVAAYAVPGRSTPVTRFDSVASESGELLVTTQGSETQALKELVYAGAPLVIRTDGAVRDLDPVQIVHVMSAQRALTGAGIGTTNDRRWTLGFVVIDDPEPDTVASVSTWADLYAAYEGLTWQDFYDEFADGTWADVYRTDWASRAGS